MPNLVIDCKLSMALLLSKFDDMTSSYKAEDLFKEIIEENRNLNESKLNETGLKQKANLQSSTLNKRDMK